MATLPMAEPGLLSPHSSTRSPQISESVRPTDFSFLLRPDIYNSLNTFAAPVCFKNSPKQPRPDAPISELLAGGHFRAAAAAAVTELTSGTLDPTNHRRIFELLYIRLTCLMLIDATNVAAQEVKALEDLNNVTLYIDQETGQHMVPWDLRVLNVKLQAVGFDDMRRAVMSYYDLAREARASVAMARSSSERELWTARLRDIGVKVAWSLVDLDDTLGAIVHMRTLPSVVDGTVRLAEALLWLHLGDSEAAKDVVKTLAEGDERQIIEALTDMADGDFESALTQLEKLAEEAETASETVQVNRAVCLLYSGKMDKASQVLEGLIDGGFASHTLLLNLSTIYELCADKNRGLKTALASRVASREPDETGWERTNADFKL
ncbi:tetratricopeptide repeat protein 15 [Ceratocystis lukuohia]